MSARAWFDEARFRQGRYHAGVRLPPSSLLLACLALALSLSLSGCARNAILEVELTLPVAPDPASSLYAVIMVVDDEHDFDSVNIEPQHSGTLLTGDPQTIAFSVMTERADGAMRMVVYFCPNTVCAGGDVPRLPQVRYRFERATYIGRRTRFRAVIDAVPEAASTYPENCVDRCSIEGCIEGSGTFCRTDDGTHYCQERGEPIVGEPCP